MLCGTTSESPTISHKEHKRVVELTIEAAKRRVPGIAGARSTSSRNVAPNLCARFQRACLTGDFALALQLQDRLAPLHRALFLEPNPAGPKFALQLLGRGSPELRLPLVQVSPSVEKTNRVCHESCRAPRLNPALDI